MRKIEADTPLWIVVDVKNPSHVLNARNREIEAGRLIEAFLVEEEALQASDVSMMEDPIVISANMSILVENGRRFGYEGIRLNEAGCDPVSIRFALPTPEERKRLSEENQRLEEARARCIAVGQDPSLIELSIDHWRRQSTGEAH